jgi:hypothetical protein
MNIVASNPKYLENESGNGSHLRMPTGEHTATVKYHHIDAQVSASCLQRIPLAAA